MITMVQNPIEAFLWTINCKIMPDSLRSLHTCSIIILRPGHFLSQGIVIGCRPCKRYWLKITHSQVLEIVFVKICRKVTNPNNSLVSLRDLTFLFGGKSLVFFVHTFLDIELPDTDVKLQ